MKSIRIVFNIIIHKKQKNRYYTFEYIQLSIRFQYGHDTSHVGHITVFCPYVPQISLLILFKNRRSLFKERYDINLRWLI